MDSVRLATTSRGWAAIHRPGMDYAGLDQLARLIARLARLLQTKSGHPLPPSPIL